jgi:hypothetical protein
MKRKTSSRTKRFPRKPAAGARLRELWKTPEFRERMHQRNLKTAEMRKQDPERFSRAGVPDGMRRRHAVKARAKAYAAAERFIKRMEDEGQLPVAPEAGSEEQMAKEALREAYMMAVMPVAFKDKLAAIRTVLEWTKSKPASTQKIDLTSDQLLEAALQEMKNHEREHGD